MSMEQIVRFAKAHGFQAEQSGREVIIEVPAYNRRTRESFISCQPVRTMDEARSVLGY
jgi:hypothetical protein